MRPGVGNVEGESAAESLLQTRFESVIGGVADVVAILDWTEVLVFDVGKQSSSSGSKGGPSYSRKPYRRATERQVSKIYWRASQLQTLG